MVVGLAAVNQVHLHARCLHLQAAAQLLRRRLAGVAFARTTVNDARGSVSLGLGTRKLTMGPSSKKRSRPRPA